MTQAEKSYYVNVTNSSSISIGGEMLITFLLCSLVSLSNTINLRNLTSKKDMQDEMKWKEKNIL